MKKEIFEEIKRLEDTRGENFGSGYDPEWTAALINKWLDIVISSPMDVPFEECVWCKDRPLKEGLWFTVKAETVSAYKRVIKIIIDNGEKIVSERLWAL